MSRVVPLTSSIPSIQSPHRPETGVEERSGEIVDIIVPVYNSPEWVRACLRSLLCNTDWPYRLIVVDDGSDSYTRNELSTLVAEHKSSLLIANETNLGFVRSCNIGMRSSDGLHVVLLNSDAIVPPGWLSRLVRCAEADPSIGIVNPLSNEAANISIPLAPGCNFLGMDEGLQRSGKVSYPDIVTAIGFCLLLRRRMLENIGLFDEVYGMGYCEETDLCLRAMKAGWRVVACDNVYVFHRGNGSFDDRDERYRKNVKVFFERHGPEYHRAYREFVQRSPLAAIRSQTNEPPLATWRRWLSTGQVVGSDLIGCHPLRAWRHFKEGQVTRQYHRNAHRYQSFWRQNRPTVTFLFESLGAYGGVKSALRVINGLIDKGYEARAACLSGEPACERGLYTQPLYFGDIDALVAGIAESDVFISTFWTTAYWLDRLRDRFPKARFVSYVQDYEAWFQPNASEWARKVIASYEFPDAIVTTSDWLHEKLLEHGRESHIIPKGIDQDVFRPLGDEIREPLGVLAMARPHTPYRGFDSLINIFKQLHRRLPGVQLSLFGANGKALGRLEIPARNYGIVENGQALARIYNRNTVYVDPSRFQGFGMMGLEAMACGSACVLTSVGGINQYAKDKYNALLFDPSEPESAAEMIQALLSDELLRSHVVKQGLKTAAQFTLQREIDAFAEFLAGDCNVS
jgi:GT2 family glycosyltransferase/glycosyltransferase involved in cell wall biosynthesis